jgi:hypothetical protein
MTEVTVATALPLVTVPNVELMHTGQWPISTGIATFTTGDLAAAVAALDCPAVRRPVLKLGHSEPDPDESGTRWDGEPAVGYIANMGVAEGGQTLVGDYAGMPAWLGNGVLASAYPDRSIEGQYDHRCQIGHTHPFVITAVALLGVVPPGIGTLQSLQDVAALYGVAASAPPPGQPAGEPVTITVHAAREDAVPNPRPVEVRAGVTTDDVRRAFYDSDHGKSWDIWITEMQLGPVLQLITINDASGTLSRVPITIGDGDGEAAVSFGDPVPVVVRYEDAEVAAAARPADARQVVFASREESRPGAHPARDAPHTEPPAPAPEQHGSSGPAADAPPAAATPQTSSADPAGATSHPQEGAGMDPAKLREALGLLPEASDDEVRTALTTQGVVTPTTPTAEVEPEGAPADDTTPAEDDPPVGPAAEPQPVEPVSAAALPPGTVAIDETTLAELRASAQQGAEARAQQRREDRDRTLDNAIRAGKFPPARREHWAAYWDRDEEGARAAINDLAEGLVPVDDAGAPGGEPTESFDDVDRLFSVPVPKGA